jgi:hypothetical protein
MTEGQRETDVVPGTPYLIQMRSEGGAVARIARVVAAGYPHHYNSKGQPQAAGRLEGDWHLLMLVMVDSSCVVQRGTGNFADFAK